MPSFLNITKDLQDSQDPTLGQERRGWQSYHHSVSSSLKDTDAGKLIVMCILTSWNLGLRHTLSRMTEKQFYESSTHFIPPHSASVFPEACAMSTHPILCEFLNDYFYLAAIP